MAKNYHAESCRTTHPIRIAKRLKVSTVLLFRSPIRTIHRNIWPSLQEFTGFEVAIKCFSQYTVSEFVMAAVSLFAELVL